ncbi:MAG: hypothetical protein H6825_11220 [Planctomycetes bacterium]|nr:hypothetical protein [Planctomycetota bacterium]
MNTSSNGHARLRTIASVVFLAGLVLLSSTGCQRGPKGSKGKAGDPAAPPDPTPTDSVVAEADDAPELIITVLGLEGATGAGGAFMPGDSFGVNFTLTKDDGGDWGIDELDRLRILVAGPTFDYAPIFAEATDVQTAAVKNADGSYTYTYPTPIPDTYRAPLNDTTAFGADDGELQGQALLAGTYTVGMYGRWPYTVEGTTFRSIGNVTYDFLLGDGAVMSHREVVTQQNCNACHSDLQAHGGQRKEIGLCLLCHTNGAEDKNTGGATPGVTISMATMIHRIHNGAHLPSVNGVTTNPDGTRDYTADPVPYEMLGFSPTPVDFSDIMFPLWPNLAYPMPKDMGYSDLDADAKAAEDAIRRGVTACDKCHGDPDGDGPDAAPAQGMLAYQQPTRNVCGSCHDDIVWEYPYSANKEDPMPAQENDSNCVVCHAESGSSLAVRDAHLHPLLDPDQNPGLHMDITGVQAMGAGFGASAVQPGDVLEVTLTITDDDDMDVDLADVASMSVAVSGPTSNMNLITQGSFPKGRLVGDPPYTTTLPQLIQYEPSGVGTAGDDVITTDRMPLWDDYGVATTVYVVTGKVAPAVDDVLAVDAFAPANYIDLADATGFERDQLIVIDEGNPEEEYLVIQYVDGDRLWFGSLASTSYPIGLAFDHDADATVAAVEVDKLTVTDDYTVDAENGEIEEVPASDSIPDGAVVLCTYTTDFRMPFTYGIALNGSPDLGEAAGDWSGLDLLGGTYRVLFWGYRNVKVDLYDETQTYRGNTDSTPFEFLFGDATAPEPWELISDPTNCYRCHDQILFHGSGRGGVDTCLMCHGTAGSEDRPPYVAANAPATTGVTIDFREMLHKIHMGEELTNASDYTVVGFGQGYPNNYSEHQYAEVAFPAFPDGVKACFMCHGDTNESWYTPGARKHPDATLPTRNWGVTCGSCHDSDAAHAHIDANTAPSGGESCAVCHADGKIEPVQVAHKVR